MNLYADLTQVKSVLSELATADDTVLLRLAEAVSRDIDEYTRRRFYSLTATRYLSGDGSERILLPADLIAVTTLKEDADRDATYEVTWASTDYTLYPYDAAPTGAAGLETTRPFWRLEVDQRTGDRSGFTSGQRLYELVGKWGYSESKKGSGDTVQDDPLSSSATTLNVTSGGNFAVGQTIIIESEQLFITAIATNALTVERGMNGTTAAAHVKTTAISIVEYPQPVVAVCIAETARRWTAERAHYSSQLGVPDSGVVTVAGSMELREGSKRTLDPYRTGFGILV